MQKKSVVLALGAVLASAALAYATVTFDPTSGTGFVGKGDVQAAFGWNNAALQHNASAVTFTYFVEDHYDVACEWTSAAADPNGKPIVYGITIPRHAMVNSSIAYNPRVRNQISGFTLGGFGTFAADVNVPVVGASCPGLAYIGAIVSSVTRSSAYGGLFVSHGGTSVLLQ